MYDKYINAMNCTNNFLSSELSDETAVRRKFSRSLRFPKAFSTMSLLRYKSKAAMGSLRLRKSNRNSQENIFISMFFSIPRYNSHGNEGIMLLVFLILIQPLLNFVLLDLIQMINKRHYNKTKNCCTNKCNC